MNGTQPPPNSSTSVNGVELATAHRDADLITAAKVELVGMVVPLRVSEVDRVELVEELLERDVLAAVREARSWPDCSIERGRITPVLQPHVADVHTTCIRHGGHCHGSDRQNGDRASNKACTHTLVPSHLSARVHAVYGGKRTPGGSNGQSVDGRRTAEVDNEALVYPTSTRSVYVLAENARKHHL